MQQYDDEIQLKDILIKFSEYKAFLLKKKFLIFISSLLFCLVGVVFAFFSDTKYNAELTFVVEQDGGASLGSMSSIANLVGFDFGGMQSSTFSQSNIIELLKSRGVIVSALVQNAKINGETDCLIEHYIEINNIKEKEGWDDYDFLRGISFCDNNGYIYDSISGVIWEELIEDDLTVELRSDESNIITLSYTSLNQDFAREFVKRLIDQMIKMYIIHETSQANNTLDFYKDRADSVFAELEIAEQEFARVQDINRRIIKATGRLKELQLMRRVEVLNTMYLEIVKNLELSKIALLNKTPIINIIDEPILPLEEDKTSILLGGFLGGFLGAFLSLCYFIVKKLFRDTLKESSPNSPSQSL